VPSARRRARRGESLVPAGVHEIGDVLRVRFSSPEGVAVSGFEPERVGAAADQTPDDADREEQLRALGYLE
jgi:hypothetical protein